jgi:hypothetical protein
MAALVSDEHTIDIRPGNETVHARCTESLMTGIGEIADREAAATGISRNKVFAATVRRLIALGIQMDRIRSEHRAL